MKLSSVSYLRCVRCAKKLELESLVEKKEIDEGFLNCNSCKIKYPIIMQIPVLWDDFSSYLSNRPSLGGEFLIDCKTDIMKSFVKKAMSSKKPTEDKSIIEKRWSRIYQDSNKSKFYLHVRSEIKKYKTLGIILEHGCSIGIISNSISNCGKIIFGIDRSFHAIKIAKQNQKKNTDYFVADSQFHPFGTQKFDLILCLNMLEIVEPKNLVKIISNQISKGVVVLSDPYDFDRGINSVKEPVGPQELRNLLEKFHFKISKSTKKPSHIQWELKINPRAKLQYKVDLITAQK